MRASVVVPTRNRGAAIEATLESLLAQEHPDHEVLLVDNGSRPECAAILQGWAARGGPRWRYLSQPEPGLNLARNRGVAAAEGEWIAFLDDDAVAPRHWLSALESAFEADPEAWALGGRITNEFDGPPPEGLDERMQLMLGEFDRGEDLVELVFDDYPRGTNMAFRRAAFEECGPFRECLDRRGDLLLSYGDVEMCYRVGLSGHRVLYVPDAGVQHRIRTDRLNFAWVVLRSYWQGRSEALFERIHRGRWHLLRKLPYRALRSVLSRDLPARAQHRGLLVGTLTSWWRSRFD